MRLNNNLGLGLFASLVSVMSTAPASAQQPKPKVFLDQQAYGLEVWMQPMVRLRAPKIFNVRSDPFERSEHEAGAYDTWSIEHAFVLVPAQAIGGEYLKSFQQFPPRQRLGSFSVDKAMQILMEQKTNN
jgi:hypothetical protein